MKKRNLPLIGGVLVALVVLALLNRVANNASQNPSDQQQAAAAQQTPAVSPKTAQANGSETQPLITQATVGDVATAKVRATLGYTVDNYVATHTDQVNQTIQQVENWAKRNQISCAQIVCLDIPPSLRNDPSTADVPLGLSVNGKPVPGLATEIGPGLQWRTGLDESLYSTTGAIEYANGRKGPR